jgi:predicted nucleic acid-binding protein
VTAEVGLADTSIFIGQEQQRSFRTDVPPMLAVSYVTVAELTLGVLNAAPDNRAARLETLIRVRQFDPLPVDDRVAVAWAELRRALREAGRRLVGNDAWIAATAIAHGLPLVTQDDDYKDLPGLTVIRL